MENNLFGLMLMLKKRMSVAKKPKDNSHFLIYGIYDALDLRGVENWYDMRPAGVEQRSGFSTVQGEFLDKYTVKAYFQEIDGNQPGREGFNQRAGLYKDLIYFLEDKNQGGNAKEIVRHFPFITLAMLNVTPEFVRGTVSSRAMTESVADYLIKAADEEGISLDEIHCAIFPSIGYSDFVLMFLTKELADVMYLIDSLKNKRDPDGSFVASQIYPISGVYNGGIGDLEAGASANIMASVRINLRSGRTMAEFKNCLEEEGRELATDIKEKLTSGGLMYHAFENVDCLLLPDVPFVKFLPLYFGDNILSPEGQLFQDYIESTRTTLRVKEKKLTEQKLLTQSAPVADKPSSVPVKASKGKNNQAEEDDNDNQAEKNDNDNQTKRMSNCFDKLYKFMEGNNMPVRIVVGIQKVMKSYLNLTSYRHAFDIQAILWPAFDALAYNIDLTIDTYNAWKEKLLRCLNGTEEERAEVENIEYELERYMKGLCRALETFRAKIGEYLSDLQRSDKNFLDGQLLTHQSIGSATKLLFFYNQYINRTARKLVNASTDQAGQEYYFVVVSGGNDETVSSDLFGYLDQLNPNLRSLIISTIPEMSLYDVKGTMFRLLHECFHFCGTRFREERCGAIRKAVASYVGWNTARLEFDSLRMEQGDRDEASTYGRTSHMVFGNSIYKNKQDEADEKRRNILCKYEQLMRKTLADELDQMLEKGLADILPKDGNGNPEEGSLFMEQLKENLAGLCSQIFLTPFRNKEGFNFPGLMYDTMLDTMVDMTGEMIALLRDYHVRYSEFNIMLEELSYYKRQGRAGVCDEDTKKFVEIMSQRYASNEVVLEPGVFVVAEKNMASTDKVISIVSDAVLEVFCDVMAAKLLNANLEDFLLAGLYECWDLPTAYPDTQMNALRVGLELKILYNVDGELGNESKEQIKKKFEYWGHRGFHYHNIKTDELVQWINKLLGIYNSEGIRQMVEPIKSYIENCLGYCPPGTGELFAKEQALYKAADLEEAKDLQEMLDTIITYWGTLADADGGVETGE